MIWLRSLLPTALALLLALILSLFFSDTLAARWLAVALVIQALLVTLVMSRLHFWAALPRQRALPEIGGVWQPLLDRAGRYRFDRRQKLRSFKIVLQITALARQ